VGVAIACGKTESSSITSLAIHLLEALEGGGVQRSVPDGVLLIVKMVQVILNERLIHREEYLYSMCQK